MHTLGSKHTHTHTHPRFEFTHIPKKTAAAPNTRTAITGGQRAQLASCEKYSKTVSHDSTNTCEAYKSRTQTVCGIILSSTRKPSTSLSISSSYILDHECCISHLRRRSHSILFGSVIFFFGSFEFVNTQIFKNTHTHTLWNNTIFAVNTHECLNPAPNQY